MNWYIAKLVFKIICNEGKHTPQFDQQLRLIKANTRSSAFEKAMEIGYKDEFSLPANNTNSVSSEFLGVVELELLEMISDGMTLYTSTRELNNADPYIDFVKAKSRYLEQHLQPSSTYSFAVSG